jgi:hypothetical protein
VTTGLYPHVDSAESIRRAWQRYLAEVRGAEAETYERVEEMAWRRLVGKLTALGTPPPSGSTGG